jgi:hypothetical protein
MTKRLVLLVIVAMAALAVAIPSAGATAKPQLKCVPWFCGPAPHH